MLFGWELHNRNTVRQNEAGIDLVDTTNKIVIQVSATATKQNYKRRRGGLFIKNLENLQPEPVAKLDDPVS